MADIAHNLDESDLSILADVVAYDAVSYAPRNDQIDKRMRPLFQREDLAPH